MTGKSHVGGREPMNAQVLALVNQKGGTGKSTSCVNLGIGLAMAGKKVHFCIAGGNASWYNPFGCQCGNFSEN